MLGKGKALPHFRWVFLVIALVQLLKKFPHRAVGLPLRCPPAPQRVGNIFLIPLTQDERFLAAETQPLLFPRSFPVAAGGSRVRACPWRAAHADLTRGGRQRRARSNSAACCPRRGARGARGPQLPPLLPFCVRSPHGPVSDPVSVLRPRTEYPRLALFVFSGNAGLRASPKPPCAPLVQHPRGGACGGCWGTAAPPGRGCSRLPSANLVAASLCESPGLAPAAQGRVIACGIGRAEMPSARL